MSKKYYEQVPRVPNFPKIEEEVLQYWRNNDTFNKSVQRNEKHYLQSNKKVALTQKSSNGDKHTRSNDFVFYDGPPFANGLPHYGHLVTGFIKDIVPRYQTMKGKRVERRFGWDTHGLPAELQSEKELNVSGRLEIIKYGVEAFNKHCEKSVLRFTEEWESYVTRQARWVDFKNSYKTMDFTFMESVLWAFKTLWDKGLIYEDFRVVPYSWAMESPLSNFEIRMDNATRPRQDPTVTVAFKLKGGLGDILPARKNFTSKPVYIAAWTTTPWTLPSNLALAVGKDMDYAVLENDSAAYIFSVGVVEKYAKEIEKLHLQQTATLKGTTLDAMPYEPLFPYFAGHTNAFRILSVDWVEDGEGTGCVHLAPGFGEIDMQTCRQAHIDLVVPVDSRGCFTEAVYDYKGQHVFDTNKDIARVLRQKGQLINFETYVHNYPHCWRTDTPIIYRAIDGWYVKVESIKDRMVELNQDICWIPGHIKEGQFGRWLENARDWNISRDRFWGTPIPVWKSDDPKYPRVDVYGSKKDLERDFGVKCQNFHRPYIDTLTRPNPDDPTGKSTMRRVTGVLDCWFESGSMPFAQIHYPFDNKQWFENNFPGDFIVEYVAQTRGWFYTLMVMSTALFDRTPFKNCICHGVVLDENHQKLSKRLKNYPDPVEMFNTHGADAMRWYMVSSPLMVGGDLAMDKNGVAIGNTVRQVLIPIWNAYYFFTLYANAEGIVAKTLEYSLDIMDTYILSKVRILAESVQQKMDMFELGAATAEILRFIDIMNNWYIRRNRERFWANDTDTHSTQVAFDTLYTVLEIVCRVVAPFLPMITESIYRGLTGRESVHLMEYPTVDSLPKDHVLMRHMDLIRDACSSALAIREKVRIRVRQPLTSMTIVTPAVEGLDALLDIVKEEVNVKHIVLDSKLEKYGQMQLVVNPKIGKRLGNAMKEVMIQAKAGKWQHGENGTVVVAGQVLGGEDFSLRLQTAEGVSSHMLPRGQGVVILDTKITPELEAEGLVRDTVRLIQNTRKSENLHISDRIDLTIYAEQKLLQALSKHASFIEGEVLATKLSLHPLTKEPAPVTITAESAIGNSKIILTICKVQRQT